MYRKEMIVSRRLESLSRWNPFIPRPKSSKYQRIQKMLASAGIYSSVEYFFTIKLFACIFGTLFFIGIALTNAELLIEDIIKDPNYGKTAIDSRTADTANNREKEKGIYLSIQKQFEAKGVNSTNFANKGNKPMLVEYIENLIVSSGLSTEEDAVIIAQRMYEKLAKVSTERHKAARVLYLFMLSLLLYNIPDIFAKLKIKLIEDKKDWETLNCTYVYSIFGRLPPYNIRTILSNMLVVVEVYRPLISELCEALKNGKGEKAFDEVLPRTENQDLYEMLETMKLSIKTGVLNTIDMVDETAENQLKWLEIKGIKRRKAKQLFAMIPVVIVMLLAAVYFSYSLSILSNPTNYIR